MRKIFVILAIALLVIICIFTLAMVLFNSNFEAEQSKHQQEIEKIKQEQLRLDAEFSEQQRTRQQQQIDAENAQASRMKLDMDGDGLTLEQEIRLGTSDEKRDSDGDSIMDNVDRNPAGGGKIHTITVDWIHNNRPFSTQFGIAEDRYWYYKDQTRNTSADSKFATPHDPVIQTIANDIVDASLSAGEPCKYCLAIDFVESMTYQYDIDYNSNKEYPKYAIETIIDKRGDCEDTSFLMASIFEALNVDTVLLLYSDHMAIGFYSDTCPGDSYTHQGRNYCFLETTGVPDSSGEFFYVWGKYVNEMPYVIEVT